MLTDKEIISFQKNGYLIKKSKELDSINYLQNKVFNLISKKNKNLNNIKKSNKTVFFQKLHKHINKKKLNEIRLSVVNGINSDSKFYKSYYKSAAEMLDGLVGNEIAMQKKINISIQIPNDEIFLATLPAAPKRSSVLSILTIGTGASGEIRSALPNQYLSKIKSPTISIFESL